MNIRTLRKKLKEKGLDEFKVIREDGNIVILKDRIRLRLVKNMEHFYTAYLYYATLIAQFYFGNLIDDPHDTVIDIVSKVKLTIPYLDQLVNIKNILFSKLNMHIDVFLYIDNLQFDFHSEDPIKRITYSILLKVDTTNNELVLEDISVKIKKQYYLPDDLGEIEDDLNIIKQEKEKIKNILKEVEVYEF